VQQLPRQLSPPVAASEVLDPPSPAPRWCHRYHGDSTCKPEALPKPSRGVRGLLVLLPYPSTHRTPFPNATTFSPTVPSPSHRPLPSPSELNAICALRNTPQSFLFPVFLGFMTSLDSAVIRPKLFSCQTLSKKPTLVHGSSPPPSPWHFIQGNHMGEFWWIGFQKWLNCTPSRRMKSVSTHPYSFCNWGHINKIKFSGSFVSLGASQEVCQGSRGSQNST